MLSHLSQMLYILRDKLEDATIVGSSDLQIAEATFNPIRKVHPTKMRRSSRPYPMVQCHLARYRRTTPMVAKIEMAMLMWR